MKTAELIKQAEEILRLPEHTTSGIFISIAYNPLIKKLIDRLKRYEEALLKIRIETEDKYIKNTENAFSFISYTTRKALGEE